MKSKNILKFERPQKILVMVLTAFLLFGLGAFFWSKSSTSAVFHYVLGQKQVLKLANNKVNILLLGIGGVGHDGPNLTDTMIVASYDNSSHLVTLISLPRDLWVDSRQVKVNALYQLGLSQRNGLGLVQNEVEKILGLQIPYTVRLDFNGFVRAVDLIGGIDVLVAHSFTDTLYPWEGHEADLCDYQEKVVDLTDAEAKDLNLTAGKHLALVDQSGKIATASASETAQIPYTDQQVAKLFPCRFELLQFQQGLTHMDGILALKYVRSRHGSGNEGSDFARSRRQEQILQAFKEKVLSVDTLSDPTKVVNLIAGFGSSIDTNISASEYLEMAKLIKNVSGVKSFVIDESGNPPLLLTPKPADYGGAWILIPPDNDFSEIHQYVATILSGQESSDSGRQNRRP